MIKVKENLERIQALQDRYKSEAKFEAESWFERGAVPNAEFHQSGIRYRAKIDALQWVLNLDWSGDENG